jgi:hypothetical protein
MAEIKTVVCDSCGGTPAVAWAMGERGRKPWVVDLCSTCATPLLGWQKHARSGEGQRRPYRRVSKTDADPA